MAQLYLLCLLVGSIFFDFGQSECPATVNQMAGKCAIVHDNEDCSGESASIPSGFTDLTKLRAPSGVTWKNRVSSLQLIPKCSLMLCKSARGHKICTDYHGGIYGEIISSIPEDFNDRGVSLMCTCETPPVVACTNEPSPTPLVTNNAAADAAETDCPTHMPRTLNTSNTDIICAYIYDLVDCMGDMVIITKKANERRTVTNLKTKRSQNGGDMSNKAKSMLLQKGCSVKYCYYENLEGSYCTTIDVTEAVKYVAFNSFYSNNVKSVACACATR